MPLLLGIIIALLVAAAAGGWWWVVPLAIGLVIQAKFGNMIVRTLVVVAGCIMLASM